MQNYSTGKDVINTVNISGTRDQVGNLTEFLGRRRYWEMRLGDFATWRVPLWPSGFAAFIVGDNTREIILTNNEGGMSVDNA